MATRQTRGGAVADIASLTRMQPFAVLSPHPDDETLGCGGLIARAVRLGLDPVVIVLTDGGASHQAPGWPARRLAAQRAAEIAGAMAELGLPARRLHLLQQEDGALQASARLIATVAGIVAETSVQTLFVTDPADSHPDHVAAFRLAVRLLADGAVSALVSYPVSQRLKGCDLARFERLTVGCELDAKRRAIARHRSQIGALLPAGTGFELDRRAIATFQQPVELFHPIHGLPACLPPDDPGHFDRLFTASSDPWNYEGSSYERGRHATTVELLSDRSFGRAWEAGTAGGVLAEQLLPLCRTLVATDASEVAVACARARLGGRAEVRCMRLPHEVPDGPFDLILLSDMLYYLGLDGVIATARACLDRLAPGGRILVVSWLGDTEAALTGVESAEAFAACVLPALMQCARLDRPGFRVDMFERPVL